MAHREQAPYKAQNPQEVKGLVQTLGKGKGKNGVSVKKATFTLSNGYDVNSWRMQDWDYKKQNLPTYSRGLFTYINKEGKHEIAVRGYDKFFNHGEVRKTEWRNVEEHTRGPYELSVKENGCIIFIAGLDDDTLLVCSKHSTGTRKDVALSHAEAGERWVEKHLAQMGKTKKDLARKLRSMNATAVAELCDDAFEEHVLAYTPDSAGLYLHGINLNLPEFVTYPGHLVDKFAEEWGFKKTMYVMEDDVFKVRSFLDEVAETGNYAGRDTEGFVIRCQARENEDSPWEDWFFKYKFEEPYLMYRQWRECTKALIAGKPPRFKKHKQITEEYLKYARKRFAKDPSLTSKYNQNHGIIALRDDFLNSRGLKGSDIIRQEMENGEVGSSEVTENIVLIPVASIGCGKTTVALALTHLFGWGHFQNDNVKGKQRRPQRFAEAVTALMVPHTVVIADRNNHQMRERQQIMDDVHAKVPNARFVALYYVHDRSNYDQIRQATRKRVLSRGDNHQTIQAGSKSQEEIIEIMEGFLHRFQPVNPSEPPDDMFDLVINLDVSASSRENLETIISRLHNEYPKLFPENMPTSEELDKAIDGALNSYTPEFRQDLGRTSKQSKKHQPNSTAGSSKDTAVAPTKKIPRVEYFGVRVPAQRITSVLTSTFANKDAQTAQFYRQLLQSRRIQAEFHVTLIHRVMSEQHSEIWKKLIDLHTPLFQSEQQEAKVGPHFIEPELGKCNVELERLLWDKRIMCFVVRLVPETSNEQPTEFQTVNQVAHITVGTGGPNVKPKESNDLIQRWLESGSGPETGIQEISIKGNVVLEGVVKGVLSKF